MPRAGRRRSVVWACFVENAASGKRRVLCRFCDHDLVANPIRMVRHIVKHCPNADEQHKKICREYQTLAVPPRRRGGDGDDGHAHADSDALHVAHPSAHTPHALPSEVPPSVALSFGLPHAVAQFAIASLQQPDGTDPHAPAHCMEAPSVSPAPDASVVERVHDELALALATTEGSPLALLDNPRFARALQLMHVPVLTATDIETCVVPRLCKRIETEALAAMETATTITVQITALTVEGSDSGWDVFAADQDHRQAPLERLPLTASSEALVSLVRSRFSELPRKPACELHLCTDTFGIAARAFSVADQHPQLPAAPVFVAGCLMQASLLLLAKVVEITPRLRHAVDACAIVSERVALNSSLQRDLEGDFTMSPLDDESSLWSLLAVVDQVVRHQDALRGAAVSPPLPFVGDHEFWCDAKTTQEMLRPFGFLIALSDCGHLNSSMVLVSWLLLWATAVHSSVLTEEEKTAVASTVLAHIQRHGLPLAMVCLALDPRCRGLGLSARGKRKVRAMVVASAQQFNAEVDQPALLEHVVKYLNSERPFDDEASWQMMASLPRLFWVEYNAEAHELASVALASLSFRPYIHSLQHTWTMAGASPCSTTEPRPSHHKEISTLKRLAFQLDMVKKAASDDRKQALAIAAGLLLTGSTTAAPPSEDTGATASSYSSALPAASPHAFWTRLRRVVETFAPDEDASTGNETDGGDTVDAAWFDVDARGAVHQLQTCLHHTLFGDFPELRVDSIDHADAHAHDREQVASPSVEESASALLSGLEEL